MKNKIRLRLFLYFMVSLLIFSLLIGGIFTSLFTRYNLELHKKGLAARAIKIAETLSSFSIQGAGHGGMGHGGYGSYLRFIDDIAMADVWIVDPDLDSILRGHGQAGLAYKDLPENAERVIAAAMSGETAFSESFSPVLGTPAITVATPITPAGNQVAGVVLLHEQLEDISGAAAMGLRLLIISMTIAVFISFGVAGILSTRFARPLGRMRLAAEQISSGNFSVKTGIVQNDEIGELAQAMDKMAVRLEVASNESEKLDKLRRDFVANISHELRTPITVLRASLEALRDGVVAQPDLVEYYYEQMLAESIHLERLVSDLLDLSKLQNPDFKMEMQTVNLSEVARDAIFSMDKIAREKGIQIEMSSHQGDYAMSGDYGRLRQMLVIVLDNAIKFSPQDSTILVALSQKAGGLTLAISDQGHGIPGVDLPHIFDRFYKKGSKQNKGGTGLGLAIAHRIILLHQGTINATSTKDGTVFTVELFNKKK